MYQKTLWSHDFIDGLKTDFLVSPHTIVLTVFFNRFFDTELIVLLIRFVPNLYHKALYNTCLKHFLALNAHTDIHTTRIYVVC